MRMFITILLLATVGLPASAKSKAVPASKRKAAASKPSKFTGKLLSYEALVRLPKAKRKKYLRETIDLLATMESFNNRYTVAERSQLNEMREQVAELMKMISLLPEAKADDYDDEPPVVDIARIVPAHTGNDWTCGTGAKFDSVFQTCVVLNAAGQTAFSPSNATDENAIKCPGGSHETPHYRGESVACIPAASWARIPAARKALLSAKTFESVQSFRTKPFDQQRSAVLGGPYREPTPSSTSTPSAPVTPSGPASATTPAAATLSTPPVFDAGDAQPVGPSETATAVPPNETATAVPPGETARLIGPDGEPVAPAPGASAPAAEPQASSTPPAPETAAPATPAAPTPPAAPDTCEPAVKACGKLTAADKQTAITRFRSSEPYQGVDANICIAGGFPSKYKGTTKSEMSCEIVRSLDLGGGKTTTPCAADEALCNPVLFCLGSKNAAGRMRPVTFCVKKTGDRKNRAITDECSKKYAKMLGKPVVECPKVDPKATAKQKREAKATCEALSKIKGEACDPAFMPTEVNAKKVWQELKEKTEKLRDVWCGKLDFAALFCRECEIVNDKVYAMNKDAAGTGCPEVGAPAPAPVTTRGLAPVQAPPATQDSTGVREGAPASDTDAPRSDGR